jgi:hypothetical protein
MKGFPFPHDAKGTWGFRWLDTLLARSARRWLYDWSV